MQRALLAIGPEKVVRRGAFDTRIQAAGQQVEVAPRGAEVGHHVAGDWVVEVVEEGEVWLCGREAKVVMTEEIGL